MTKKEPAPASKWLGGKETTSTQASTPQAKPKPPLVPTPAFRNGKPVGGVKTIEFHLGVQPARIDVKSDKAV